MGALTPLVVASWTGELGSFIFLPVISVVVGTSLPALLYDAERMQVEDRNYYGAGTQISQLESFVRDECKSGRIKKLDDGLKYFDQLISQRPLPSNATFCHVLGSLSKIKCHSDVILLHKKMSLVGVQPDIFTFTILINCCCKLGKVDHGFCFLGEIIKRGYHPDTITFYTHERVVSTRED
ncbi:hypothetical protein C5167_040812 [Papaver somniferum]|uniref:Pentatricopeptide repeat-containing protein n=1 Tax=Papaver somniferum TaxID=3469 RepID=A0A4Y7IG22_PAPSO|nr:hypothetical protein C5167_040812 [Papaver somniferum]